MVNLAVGSFLLCLRNACWPGVGGYGVSGLHPGKKALGSQQTSSATHPSTSSCKFPSAISRYLVSNPPVAQAPAITPIAQFPSAISRYLVSNVLPSTNMSGSTTRFPSAITRYLVSDWCKNHRTNKKGTRVSIRYIAVLGFQRDTSARAGG